MSRYWPYIAPRPQTREARQLAWAFLALVNEMIQRGLAADYRDAERVLQLRFSIAEIESKSHFPTPQALLDAGVDRTLPAHVPELWEKQGMGDLLTAYMQGRPYNPTQTPVERPVAPMIVSKQDKGSLRAQTAAAIQEIMDGGILSADECAHLLRIENDAVARMKTETGLQTAAYLMGKGLPALLAETNSAGWQQKGAPIREYLRAEALVQQANLDALKLVDDAPSVALPQELPPAPVVVAKAESAPQPVAVEPAPLPEPVAEKKPEAPVPSFVATRQETTAPTLPSAETPPVVVPEEVAVIAHDDVNLDEKVRAAFQAILKLYPGTTNRDIARVLRTSAMYVLGIMDNGGKIPASMGAEVGGLYAAFEKAYPKVLVDFGGDLQAFDAQNMIVAPGKAQAVPVTVLARGARSGVTSRNNQGTPTPQPKAQAPIPDSNAQAYAPPQEVAFNQEALLLHKEMGRVIRDIVKNPTDKTMSITEVRMLLNVTATRLDKIAKGLDMPTAREMRSWGWPNALPMINQAVWNKRGGPLRHYMGIGPNAPIADVPVQEVKPAASLSAPAPTPVEAKPEDPVSILRLKMSLLVKDAFAEHGNPGGHVLFNRIQDQDASLSLDDCHHAMRVLCDMFDIQPNRPGSQLNKRAHEVFQGFQNLPLPMRATIG